MVMGIINPFPTQVTAKHVDEITHMTEQLSTKLEEQTNVAMATLQVPHNVHVCEV